MDKKVPDFEDSAATEAYERRRLAEAEARLKKEAQRLHELGVTDASGNRIKTETPTDMTEDKK